LGATPCRFESGSGHHEEICASGKNTTTRPCAEAPRYNFTLLVTHSSTNALWSDADGFQIVESARFLPAVGLTAESVAPWLPQWSNLPPDRHLRDAGAYRFRRHGCFIHELADGSVTLQPHRAHWQPTTYNALHGGLLRWFEPLEQSLSGSTEWLALLRGLGNTFATSARYSRPPRWYIEAHQFRIDASHGLGRPTPEGAHRDGVDFVAVILIDRRNVTGGETRVFTEDPERVARFTITEPWTALLMDDARVTHETTPIQATAQPAYRDTLVLTYRANGFQSPET
jgi:hypothetical protein